MTRYKFKGYTITNCGYHQPDHCVWWEAVDDNGGACFHGNTLREVEFMILDYEWEQKMKKKDEEIERLKREKIEVEADALEVGGIVEAARRREATTERSSAVGNAAVMREALVHCELFLGNVSRHGHPMFCFGDQCTACNGVDELREMVVRALSAPARNCGVGTAEEQCARHRLWCSRHSVSGDMNADCANTDCSACAIVWSQMPYEAEGESDEQK